MIRSHIWLVFDVTSAMAICRHDDPFGQCQDTDTHKTTIINGKERLFSHTNFKGRGCVRTRPLQAMTTGTNALFRALRTQWGVTHLVDSE